jgi:hypothetical protein
MKPTSIDPNEEAFVQHALAAATRAQRWDRARIVVTLCAAFTAVFWLASRPSSSELGIECTILIVVGTMLGVVTAKLRSLINRNTRVVLEAIAALRSPSE